MDDRAIPVVVTVASLATHCTRLDGTSERVRGSHAPRRWHARRGVVLRVLCDDDVPVTMGARAHCS